MKKFNYTISKLILAAAVTLSATFVSCNKYLDVAPDDGLATFDMVFNMRSQAVKYLASCYSFLPDEGTVNAIGMFGGDELVSHNSSASEFANRAWLNSDCPPSYIATGLQNVTSPYCNDWTNMYQALRYCDSMVDNIDAVPDMEEWEKKQWAAEAKVLKAYYLFNLVRKWGPVPIIRESLPVNASVDEARVYRDNVDDCFDYMFELIDEAMPDLELLEETESELGRINKMIAAAIKAKMAVTAASPLFNNNADEASLVDERGIQLFPTKTADEEQARWDYAVTACKEAIDLAHEANKELYYYTGTYRTLNSHIVQELTIRGALCDNFNDEVIWGCTKEYTTTAYHFNRLLCTRIAAKFYPNMQGLWGYEGDAAATKNIADLFYTKNGIPVDYDLERSSVNETDERLVKGTDDEKWNLVAGYKTAECYFDREPRFYSDLGFDGSVWHSTAVFTTTKDPDYNSLYIINRNLANMGMYTGYVCKKLVSWDMTYTNSSINYNRYWTFPKIRLADLYLLYAEAINEAEGPAGANSEDLYHYLNAVRERAGIPDVKEAWDTYSSAPGKYSTKEGMREIIHRERTSELAFEGHRFWDLRRWKEATDAYNTPIIGWNWESYASRAKYYQEIEVQTRTFSLKDYFWPIQTSILENNPRLVQNLGWQ